jgi:hypothetical protein
MADVLERMNADTLAEQITLIGVLLNSSTPMRPRTKPQNPCHGPCRCGYYRDACLIRTESLRALKCTSVAENDVRLKQVARFGAYCTALNNIVGTCCRSVTLSKAQPNHGWKAVYLLDAQESGLLSCPHSCPKTQTPRCALKCIAHLFVLKGVRPPRGDIFFKLHRDACEEREYRRAQQLIAEF